MNYVVFLVVFRSRPSLWPISHYFPLDSGKQIVYKAKNLHFAALIKKRLLTETLVAPGGLEPSEPGEEAAGESKRSDSGSEEDSRLSAT